MKNFIILASLLISTVSWSKTYTIKKGNHKASGIHSGLFVKSELSIKVKFDNSAIYTSKLPANQWAINKLFGFSDCFSHHQTNSARFGWRYLNSKLELMAYNYVKKQRWEEKIGDLKMNEWQEMKIKMDKSNYIFSFAGKTVKMPRGCSNKNANGYKLFPYFGGEETAPHDIKIEIE